MNLIKSMNSATSNVWAGFILVAGIATLFGADLIHQDVVLKAVLGAGASLIAGSLILFQHQPSSKESDPEVHDTTRPRT